MSSNGSKRNSQNSLRLVRPNVSGEARRDATRSVAPLEIATSPLRQMSLVACANELVRCHRADRARRVYIIVRLLTVQ